MTDRERAILALRRGVPLGKVVTCSCFTHPPTRNGCFGVCEDTVAAIVASYEALRADTLADRAGTVPSPNEAIAAMVEAWHQDFIGRPLAAHVLGELQRRIATLFQEHRSSPENGPIFECPDCGADLAVDKHVPGCARLPGTITSG